MNHKKNQLRKHKQIATGLFLFMAAVYCVMVYLLKYSPTSWMGYVKAFSEAAMVGALADWFAVTALFRHPMGLKIPHTNLIENKKNAIGDNLGNFVSDNFLTPANIRPYVQKIDVAQLLNNWLQQDKNKQIIETEIIYMAQSVLHGVDNATVISFLKQKAQSGIDTINWQKLTAKGLKYLIDQGKTNRVIALVIPKIQDYIQENRTVIYQQIIEKKPLLGLIGGHTVTDQLIKGLTTFLTDIYDNEEHKIRIEITHQLQVLITEIESSDSWKEKLNTLIHSFLTPEVINEYTSSFWENAKKEIKAQLHDSNSVLNQYVSNQINQFTINLSTDLELQQKINNWAQTSIYRLALKNSKEVSLVIKNTVEKWDGKELSEKLELEVGKDLQFIRINGTLIGGIVGLFIYIITSWI